MEGEAMSRQQIGVPRKVILPKELLAELRVIAAWRGEPVAETIRTALAEFVKRSHKGRRAA
jgi:hypothetical protein